MRSQLMTRTIFEGTGRPFRLIPLHKNKNRTTEKIIILTYFMTKVGLLADLVTCCTYWLWACFNLINGDRKPSDWLTINIYII